MSKQRVRLPQAAPAEWKTVVIAAADPLVFAKELQEGLQELTDTGFLLSQQMTRGTAHVLVAHRPRSSTPTQPSTLLSGGETTEEVLYHYLEEQEQKQAVFSSVAEAMVLVKQHLAGETVLPLNLSVVTITRFETEELVTPFGVTAVRSGGTHGPG